jgi:uncharacterized protein YqeY
MTIKERLSEDLKTAMKSGDVVTRSTIRLVLSALKNEEIEKRKESDDQAVTEILARMTRQYRESIEMYQNANRDDLVASEQAELVVIMRYLPEQLSQDEVLALAKKAVEDAGASGPDDRGKVMGRLMPQLRGKADGTMVNTVVTELLESMAG